MGRNMNGVFDPGQNIDMSRQKPDGFKTDESKWPKEREQIEDGNREWRHSDYIDMAYQHVYTLFKKIKTGTSCTLYCFNTSLSSSAS